MVLEVGCGYPKEFCVPFPLDEDRGVLWHDSTVSSIKVP